MKYSFTDPDFLNGFRMKIRAKPKNTAYKAPA